jgi:hypothetical protein
MIRNIRELAREVGIPDCFEGDFGEAVGRYVFKSTECGCVFESFDNGVRFAGYAEGADAECPDHYLKYPFSADEFWTRLAYADWEGVEMWHEWNDEWEPYVSHEEGV